METVTVENPSGGQYKPITPEGEGSLGMGIVGGLVAALIGGVVWTLVVVFTDREIGIVAWGIGFVCGLGVVLLGKGKGVSFQIVAVVASITGILIGKYGSYYVVVKRVVLEQYGEEAVANVALFSGSLIAGFIEYMPSMLSPFDILWVVLAVATAWKAVGARSAQAA